jgi:hypothetical protein
MNVKKAKALRKLMNYHPTDERKYETQKIYTSLGRVKEARRTRVNSEKSTRSAYREAKRLAS